MTEIITERGVHTSMNPIVDYAIPPVDHAIAAMERQLLSLGFPLELLAKMMMQHAASVIALIDSPVMRQEIMQKLIGNFPSMVQVAKVAAASTKGGVMLPRGTQPEEPVRTI